MSSRRRSLDEPTAALGVAQTAEVLNLIERLRERGHGVVLISHNMADVLAVADRIVVLRLGRNNGEFSASEVTSETLIAAITGAIDAGRRTPPPPRTADHDDAAVEDGRVIPLSSRRRRVAGGPGASR